MTSTPLTLRELAGIEDLERTSKVYLKGSHLRPLTARMEGELRRLLPARLEGQRTLELYRFIWDLMFGAAAEACGAVSPSRRSISPAKWM